MIGMFSHIKISACCEDVRRRALRSEERRQSSSIFKSSVFEEQGGGERKVSRAPHWSSPQHTTRVSQWRGSSKGVRAPIGFFKTR